MNQQDSPPGSGSRKWWLLGILVAVIAVQSVTVTPALRLRYVSADSGIPIEGLVVVAVWQLRAGNLAGSVGAGVIRVHEARTDRQGDVRIGGAVMLHVPVMPFSLLYRDVQYLPVAYVDDSRYESNVAASGLRKSSNRAPKPFLSYQDAALDGETWRLVPSRNTAVSYHREVVRRQIREAYSSCRQSWVCKEVES